jgi:hypothetical protein
VQIAMWVFGLYLVVRSSIGLSGALLRRVFGIAEPGWLVSFGVMLLIFLILLLALGGVMTLVKRWRGKRGGMTLRGQSA